MSRDCCSTGPLTLSRRAALGAAAAALGSVGLGLAAPPRSAGAGAGAGEEVAPALVVHPRTSWSGGLTPSPELPVEAPGDVRFLLVHHTASSNRYSPDDVAGQLRAFHRFHTGPDRGWPDIAYNFLVDRYGGVWEGRSGSLAGPVMPDATGGSQGFAQLACFIGDLNAEAPTAPARDAMLRVLAWLADRYGVDTRPGATVRFTSRGSNRHPKGAMVTTATIAGHRDMSLTTCPGDRVYPQVRQDFPREVSALRVALPPSPGGQSSAPAPAPASSSDVPPSPTSGPREDTAVPPAPVTPSVSSSASPVPIPSAPSGTSRATPSDPGGDGTGDPLFVAGAAAAAAGAAVAVALRRASRTARAATPPRDRAGAPEPERRGESEGKDAWDEDDGHASS